MWCCWVCQISCILSWSKSLMPMVSVAPLKSLSSFPMSCLVSWAPRVRRRQCLASSFAVGWQPVECLASFSLSTSEASHSKMQAERFLMKVLYTPVCGHSNCEPPHKVPHIQPDSQLVPLCKQSSCLAFSCGRAAVPVHVKDFRRSFSSSAVALHYSRAHGKQAITLWRRKDTHEDLPKLIAHVCGPCCCSSCLASELLSDLK